MLDALWPLSVVLSVVHAAAVGRLSGLLSAFLSGASEAVKLCITMAGPICLWSGLGTLAQRLGLTARLSRMLRPVLGRLYPSAQSDGLLAQALAGNFCANLLGLGNAATPMGIQAARRLKDPSHPGTATDQLCRLVVMNTASVQLLPTTAASIRAARGCASPMDLLPCVWLTSLCSVCTGLGLCLLLQGRKCRG